MAEQAPGSMTQAAPESMDGKSTVSKLRAAVSASINERKSRLEAWKNNVDMRCQKLFGGQLGDDDVRDRLSSPEDWARTKQKQSQLMFKLPKIVARPCRPEFKPSAPAVTSLVNKKLAKEINAAYMIDETLADVINAAGLMVSSLGVLEFSRPTSIAATDPETGAPLTDEAGQPIMQQVMQPLAKKFYWERISPAAFLWPTEFTGSNWDEAPWLGYEIYMPVDLAKKQFPNLPENVKTCKKPSLLSEDITNAERSTTSPSAYVKLQVIWYRAVLFDEDAFHPDHLRRIILLDGQTEPLEHGDTNWQKWVDPIPALPETPPGMDPMTGQPTPGAPGKPEQPGHFIGIRTFPVRVETLTYVSDMAVPPSDSAAGRPQVKELIRSRTQMLRQRDQSIPIRWYDTNRLDTTIADALRAGTWQDMIPVNGPGERTIGEVSRAQYPRENFQFQNVLNSDLDRAWSLSNNQLATANSSERSATEVNAISSAAQIRLDYEKERVNRYVAKGCAVLFNLLQMFMTEPDYVEVVGDAGAKELVKITQAEMQGAEYEFEFVPDTSDRVDIQTKQGNSLKLYNLLGNSPTVNRSALEADIMITHGYDPTELVVQQPEKGPEPPNISYRFGTEDMLNPFAVAIMQKSQKITAQEIQGAATLIMDSMKQLMDAKQKLGLDPMEMGMGMGAAPPVASAGQLPPSGQVPTDPGPVESPTPTEPILKRLNDGSRMM